MSCSGDALQIKRSFVCEWKGREHTSLWDVAGVAAALQKVRLAFEEGRRPLLQYSFCALLLWPVLSRFAVAAQRPGHWIGALFAMGIFPIKNGLEMPSLTINQKLLESSLLCYRKVLYNTPHSSAPVPPSVCSRCSDLIRCGHCLNPSHR